MSKTGRAVVYDEPNKPFVVREYPVQDVTAREVLVKSQALSLDSTV